MAIVSYMTRQHLLTLREIESANPGFRFNAAPSEEMLVQIPDNIKMNVFEAFAHLQPPGDPRPFDNVMRVVAMAPWRGEVVPLTVDMPLEMYATLPVIEIDDRAKGGAA